MFAVVVKGCLTNRALFQAIIKPDMLVSGEEQVRLDLSPEERESGQEKLQEEGN